MSKDKSGRAVVLALLIILFPTFALFQGPLFSYYDEVMGLVASAYSYYLFFSRRLHRYDQYIVIVFSLITLLGIVSNIYSSYSTDTFAIVIDVLLLWKTFFLYLFFKYCASLRNNRAVILRALRPLSKFILILVAVASVINIFYDIGVTNYEVYYGLYQYTSFWGNTIQTGWLMFGCLAVIAASDAPATFYRFLVLSLVPAVLTFSSLVYCWFFIALALTFFMRKDREVKIWNVVVIGVGVVALTFEEVVGYLLTEDAVRSTFLLTAYHLACENFPLGTGFATFGTEMAARYYSEVYIHLGWEDTWAFGHDSSLLNDNYFASILGQFGWIGFVLYLSLLYVLFREGNRREQTKRERICSVATVLTMVAVMTGSASVKSMMGCFMFALLGVLLSRPTVSPQSNRTPTEGNG